MNFKTQYNAVAAAPQSFAGAVSRTEKAGYLPAKKIIEQMVMAGLRLKAFREDHYDLGEQDEDDGESIDPTRSPGFDMADASQIALDLNRKLRKSEGIRPRKADKIDPEASPQEEKQAPIKEPAP